MLKLNLKQILWRSLLASIVSITAFVLFSSSTQAATFNITDSSACDLDNAIIAANTDAPSGSCAAGDAGGDTINMAAGTYLLGSDLTTVTDELTINGADRDTTTLDGDDLYRCLYFDGSSATFSATVTELTIQGCNDTVTSEEAIYATNISINLDQLIVQDNLEGGVSGLNINNSSYTNLILRRNTSSGNGYVLVINNSTGQLDLQNIEIYDHDTNISVLFAVASNHENVVIDNISIHDNTTDGDFSVGGNAENFTISNMSIYDNNLNFGPQFLAFETIDVENISYYQNAGEIIPLALGVASSDASFEVRNITISNNTSTNASIYGALYSGLVLIGIGEVNANASNITIADNTGYGFAILNPQDTTNPQYSVSNLILSNNSEGNCAPASSDPIGIFLPISLGGNISSDNTCASSFTNTNDLNNTNPLLGPMANNGGNGLFTRALLNQSPAINNAIASFAPNTDERGITRPACGGYDSGAYEQTDCSFVPVSATTTTTLAATGARVPILLLLAITILSAAGYVLVRARR